MCDRVNPQDAPAIKFSAEYRNAVLAVSTMARMLTAYDIPAMVAAIKRAEIAGPILGPTLYRVRAQAMLEDLEILAAARPLWEMGKRLEMLRVQRVVGKERG